ncbi:GTPase IMAP family member 4-like [Mytilus edulis]
MPFFGKPAPPNEFRFVLVGKTGAGKSRVGNTILNNKAFTFALDSKSVTAVCKLMSADKRFGKKIDLVDTPGVFDTEKNNETIQKEICRCISLTTPGPHAILFCVQMGRFTDQEIEVLEHYIKYFGQNILNYLVFVFTHLDSWRESFEDRDASVPSEDVYIKSLPEKAKSYLEKCKNRYICMDNRAKEEEKEKTVKKLIEKVEEMLSKNGNSCYTDKNYEEAEKILQTMMTVNSIRDEIKNSESFLNKVNLYLKLMFQKICLKLK